MKVVRTPLDGVVIIEPQVFSDQRGFFFEAYHRGKLAEQGFTESFVQDNHSLSRAGIVRGLHAQRLRPQGKLVRAIEGEVFDVAVDLRLGSATYRHWYGARLSAENCLQLYIPPGYAHGFSVLTERAQVLYKCTDLYSREDEFALRWNDPSLVECATPGQGKARAKGIDWQLGSVQPILSGRDAEAPLLDTLEPLLAESPAYRKATGR